MSRSYTIAFLLSAQLCLADSSGEVNWPEQAPVGDADLTAIRALLVDRHPEFASSAGVKASYYRQGGPDGDCGKELVETTLQTAQGKQTRREVRPRTECEQDFATIYFLPHRESAGRAEAVMVNCYRPSVARPSPDAQVPQWECHDAKFREYVQLDGQSCAVRLTGDMSTPALNAVREAGFLALHADGRDLPEALIVYSAEQDGYGWGTFGSNGCHPEISVEFSLERGGEAAAVESWRTVVMEH